MLPLRLGMLNAPPTKAQDLIVYLLTQQGRVESSNYRTVKLPANLNLPYFTKAKFHDFYKALFDRQASQERQRVVFTEYFWNMGWCDPCAADPLSPQELRDAGVFWLDGNPEAQFEPMHAPKGQSAHRPLSSRYEGPLPAMLTRLHVRYSAQTFPEDLMFSQTRDQENWQARYVIQQPYESSVSACSAMCKTRVDDVLRALQSFNAYGATDNYRGKNPAQLKDACLAACTASKQSGVDAAARYYPQTLPRRLRLEKQNLAELTGWSLAEIDQMSLARKGYLPASLEPLRPEPVRPDKTWWERLFNINPLH